MEMIMQSKRFSEDDLRDVRKELEELRQREAELEGQIMQNSVFRKGLIYAFSIIMGFLTIAALILGIIQAVRGN